MKKQDFFNEIIEVLELDEKSVNENTPVHLTSIKILALIIFVDEKFEKQIKIVDLKDVKTISDLMKVIGIENFKD
jgi:acyl carrier protein